MKPFNLNDALAGHPVITRSGVPVKQLKFFDGVSDEFCLYGVIENRVQNFTKTGKYMNCNENHLNDLFMQSVKVEKYINLYKTSELQTGLSLFDTEQEAIKFGKTLQCYYKTIKIDWED